MPPANQISATILCFNQADRIKIVLDSVAWCREIIIVDSGSTDGTLDILRSYPAPQYRTLHQPWLGYSQQRKFAADQTSSDWVLLLDGDEECSPQLQAELLSLPESALAHTALFEMPRKNFVAKCYIRAWSPDYQTRFIHKNRTDWAPQSAPEIRTPKSPFTAAKLKGPLLHNRLVPFSPLDLCDGIRMERHANVLADALHSRGKTASLLQLLFRPALTFFKYYFLKLGFLNGRLGLVIAYKTTVGVILKYSVLYGRELAPSKTPQTPPPPAATQLPSAPNPNTK